MEKASQETLKARFLDRKAAGDMYAVYQVKEDRSLHHYRFMPLSVIRLSGQKVEMDNYDLTYADYRDGEDLETIFTKFNVSRPSDFTGHSLSVSDMVVLKENGAYTSYYTDSIGFEEIPDFMPFAPDAETAVLEKVKTEYNEYRDSMLKNPAEEIFDYGVQNGFYKVIKDFFVNWSEMLDEGEYETLRREENILSDLWDDFIVSEDVSLQTHEEVTDFIYRYVDSLTDRRKQEINESGGAEM